MSAEQKAEGCTGIPSCEETLRFGEGTSSLSVHNQNGPRVCFFSDLEQKQPWGFSHMDGRLSPEPGHALAPVCITARTKSHTHWSYPASSSFLVAGSGIVSGTEATMLLLLLLSRFSRV